MSNNNSESSSSQQFNLGLTIGFGLGLSFASTLSGSSPARSECSRRNDSDANLSPGISYLFLSSPTNSNVDSNGLNNEEFVEQSNENLGLSLGTTELGSDCPSVSNADLPLGISSLLCSNSQSSSNYNSNKEQDEQSTHLHNNLVNEESNEDLHEQNNESVVHHNETNDDSYENDELYKSIDSGESDSSDSSDSKSTVILKDSGKSKSDSQNDKKNGEKKRQSLTIKNIKVGKNNRTKTGKVKSNVKTLFEIKHYQETTQQLIPKASFLRLVKQISDEITEEQFGQSFKWRSEAVDVIQDASESFLVELFEDMNVCAGHAKRITIKPTDMQAALKINDSYKNLKTSPSSSSSSSLASDK